MQNKVTSCQRGRLLGLSSIDMVGGQRYSHPAQSEPKSKLLPIDGFSAVAHFRRWTGATPPEVFLCLLSMVTYLRRLRVHGRRTFV